MAHSLRVSGMGIVLAGLLLSVPGAAAAQSAGNTPAALNTPWGDPDLQDTWDFRTVTPLDRPADFAEKEFLTDEDVAVFRQRELQSRDADRRGANTASDLERGYNDFWWDYGTELTEDRRTSLIVDPPNGRMSPLTPLEAERAREPRRDPAKERIVLGVVPDGPEDIGLAERCLVGFNSGPPMMPSFYNNNVQVFQIPGYVVLFTEMIHETRFIPLDGRPHLPQSMRQWLGDSRGHWEGNTLVVETTNFTDKASFTGLPYLRGGSGPNMHLIERFTRVNLDRLAYEFTVEDPDAWTRPWTAVIPMKRSNSPLFEYACHEGNYAMFHMLAGARAQESVTEEAARSLSR